MISQSEFLFKYEIEAEDFERTGLSWVELESIYEDHCKSIGALETIGNYISERLRKTAGVHSVKQRVKDPEHLVEKIIRKRIENIGRDINLGNYRIEITDLVGIRVLHLFKSDWLGIHDFIVKTWTLTEKPTANIREGDPHEVISVFEDKECDIKKHPYGYRSVHYLVKSSPTKDEFIAEVQVRTIFEEGWSEIDHQVRYPNHTHDKILSQFLVVFNRLAGSADEMGSYIQFLKRSLEERDRLHHEEVENNQSVIDRLRKEIDELKIDTTKKRKLHKEINAISSREVHVPSKASILLNKIGQQINVLNSNWTGMDEIGADEVIGDYRREYEAHGYIGLEGFREKDNGFDGDISDIKSGNVLTVKIADAGSRKSIFVVHDNKGIPVGMLTNNSRAGFNDFMIGVLRTIKSHEFKIKVIALSKVLKNSSRQYFSCRTQE